MEGADRQELGRMLMTQIVDRRFRVLLDRAEKRKESGFAYYDEEAHGVGPCKLRHADVAEWCDECLLKDLHDALNGGSIIEYVKVSIVTRNGSDIVSIKTDVLPGPTHPYTDPLWLTFECARGSAEAFVAKHFPGVPIVIVKTGR